MTKPRHERARALRRRATDAERFLWQRLRLRPLPGAKFRRQHPVGAFVLDFACVEARLAIELDGSQHRAEAEADRRRTEFLASRGWRVLRFWNNEVLENPDGVFEVITRTLATPPFPRPPPGGKGPG